MKHCWHPTGAEYSMRDARGDEMRCCWCGEPGVQFFATEAEVSSGHGAFYLRKIKVRLPVEGGSAVCTAQRTNQKHPEPTP